MSGLLAGYVRWSILGNSGSGKSTLARHLSESVGVPSLALDDYVWEREMVRRPDEESLELLERDLDDGLGWIVEGCYGEIVDALAPRSTGLIFLDPGVESCVDRCRARPWEPSKFESPEAQDAHLEAFIAWVRDYPTRAGDLGYSHHRGTFDRFGGPKLRARDAAETSEELVSRVQAVLVSR